MFVGVLVNLRFWYFVVLCFDVCYCCFVCLFVWFVNSVVFLDMLCLFVLEFYFVFILEFLVLVFVLLVCLS